MYFNYCTYHAQLCADILSQTCMHHAEVMFDHCENTCLAVTKSKAALFCSIFFTVHAGFCFWKLFCTLTFLKILYFLRSHCQLSFAIYVSSLYGVLTQSSKDFIAWHNLRWNLFILYVLWVVGGASVLSEGPLDQRPAHCRLQAITPANLPHMAQSWLTARPPCYMWFPIPFIISGKWNYLCAYSFVLYLYVALCFLAPNVLLFPYTLFILSGVQYQSSCQVVSMLILIFF